MTTPEIKKVLTAYENHKFDMLKSKYPSGAITQAEMMDSFIASLDPLSHLFGSPLSQIEDMVEAVKGKTADVKTPRQILFDKYGMNITDETHPCYHVAPRVYWELMEEYASQFKPLAAMPSDAIDVLEWIGKNDWNYHDPIQGKERGWTTYPYTKYKSSAELYTAYLKRKGKTK